jgi:glycerophosphoryl diester phosphodiesterase
MRGLDEDAPIVNRPCFMGFYDYSQPLVFAHRGGCALGPENTLAAFDRGIAAGADGLELDVRLSADGIAVVHHDAMLDRTTNMSGPIASVTVEQLKRADAAYHFRDGGTFPLRGQGVNVPTLADVLRRYPEVRVIVEMKDDRAALGEAVVRDVRAADARDRVCAAGFGARATLAARAALPGLATSAYQFEVRMALYRSWLACPVRAASYGGYQVPERAGRVRVVSPRFVRHARNAGLHVQVWTVDREDDMNRLLDWGVDGLISNRPDIAVAMRNQRAAGERP